MKKFDEDLLGCLQNMQQLVDAHSQDEWEEGIKASVLRGYLVLLDQHVLKFQSILDNAFSHCRLKEHTLYDARLEDMPLNPREIRGKELKSMLLCAVQTVIDQRTLGDDHESK